MATTAAASFRATWHIGRPVQEVAPPHRKGTIALVRGTGFNANILVLFTGRPPVTFRPAQLTPL